MDGMQRAFVTGGSGYVGRNLLRALAQRGVETLALARSESSARVVEELGAKAVRADLLELQPRHLEGCDVVFHSAAFVGQSGSLELAHQINVEGTRAVIQAAGEARVIHVSTESLLIGGPTLDHADETWPYPERPLGLYAITKGAAERIAVEGGAVVVRPRFVWGRDDTTVLPELVEATNKGVLRWFDGGTYPTSTCHIDNLVHGMFMAVERGTPGEIYFLTDGEPVEFRTFISALLRSQGVEPPTASMPWALGYALGFVCEGLWKVLPGEPPVTRYAMKAFGMQCTVNDAKARREIGYDPPMSIEAGLAELARGGS